MYLQRKTIKTQSGIRSLVLIITLIHNFKGVRGINPLTLFLFNILQQTYKNQYFRDKLLSTKKSRQPYYTPPAKVSKIPPDVVEFSSRSFYNFLPTFLQRHRDEKFTDSQVILNPYIEVFLQKKWSYTLIHHLCIFRRKSEIEKVRII